MAEGSLYMSDLALRAADDAGDFVGEAGIVQCIGECAIGRHELNIDVAEQVSNSPVLVGAASDLPGDASQLDNIHVEVSGSVALTIGGHSIRDADVADIDRILTVGDVATVVTANSLQIGTIRNCCCDCGRTSIASAVQLSINDDGTATKTSAARKAETSPNSKGANADNNECDEQLVKVRPHCESPLYIRVIFI
jgi:hypothetical protein